MSKVTWNDLHEATQQDIRSTYKLPNGKRGDAMLENQVRQHLYGATQKERREFYQQFYGRRNK